MFHLQNLRTGPYKKSSGQETEKKRKVCIPSAKSLSLYSWQPFQERERESFQFKHIYEEYIPIGYHGEVQESVCFGHCRFDRMDSTPPHETNIPVLSQSGLFITNVCVSFSIFFFPLFGLVKRDFICCFFCFCIMGVGVGFFFFGLLCWFLEVGFQY